MTNADKFKGIFGIYATELWAKPEKEFLEWLNEDAPDSNVGDMISRQSAIDVTANATFSVTISGKRGFQNYKEEFEKAYVAIRDKYIEALKALPAVQLSQKHDSNTLKALDCVGRKAVIDVIKEFQRRAAEWRDEQEEYSDIWHRADSAIASAIEIGLRVKKLPSVQPDENMIYLQKEQAYMKGWEDGREALRKEILDER